MTPQSHRNEFPAGYSLASCTPAALASALPTSPMLSPEFKPVELKSANGNLSRPSLSQPKGALQGPGDPTQKTDAGRAPAS